jgi:lysophospholipase
MTSPTQTTHTAPDGTDLLVRSWEAVGPRRGSVLLVHGLAEHAGRYEHVGAHLAEQGLSVVAPDLRGFGGSQGYRAFVRSVEEYLADLDPFVEAAGSHGVPVIMLGHSMGGLIGLRYAQTRQRPDYLVLSAPMIDATIPGAKRLMARVLPRILPRLALRNQIEGEQLSRDPGVGEAYFADPFVYPRTTVALGGALLEAMAAARAGGVPVPTLVIHGEADTLVPVEFSAPLAGLDHVERITFPDFRHEPFNEDGGVVALTTVSDWIEGKLAQAAS